MIGSIKNIIYPKTLAPTIKTTPLSSFKPISITIAAIIVITIAKIYHPLFN